MSETIQTKRCSKCKDFKPLSEFYRKRDRKDGHSSWCKACKKTYQQSKECKTFRKRYQKRYYQAHKAEGRECVKRYRKTLKGHLRYIWLAMLHRCNSPKHPDYKYYGGRGIRVNFASFDDFRDYVIDELQTDPRGLTIDRIDNDGHYERGNIRFVTQAENNRNKKGV